MKTGGTLWCWGANYNGELGVGDSTLRNTPTQVGTDTDWSQVSGGGGAEGATTCGVKTGGGLWCWGTSYRGELGQGDTTSSGSPVEVAGGDWRQVSVGDGNVCAVKTDDTLWCWGKNYYNEVGPGGTQYTDQTSPAQVPGTDWARVAMGVEHACAVHTGGGLECWGRNDAGQLGRGTLTTDEVQPAPVDSTATWMGTAAGWQVSCALDTSGAAHCWGTNAHGQGGVPAGDDILSPGAIDVTW